MVEINNVQILLEVLDTAGTEQFTAMRETWHSPYRQNGFIILYSLTNRASFKEVETFIEQINRVKDTDQFPCVIVG